MTTLGDAERPAKRRIIAAPSHSAMHSAETATTFSPEGYKKAAAPSVVSESKTVPLSDEDELIFPPAPSGAFMRRYIKAKQDIEDRHKQRLSTIDSYYEGVDMTTILPRDVRAIIDAGSVRDFALARAWDDCLKVVSEVTCPYCFHVLPIREVVDELKWNHPGMFTDDQLGILADQNGCKAGPLFKACPLCGEEKPQPSMIDHLVGHMRFLALKSLPPHQDDTGDLCETDEEQDKWSSTRPSSRSTIENASVDDFTFSFTGVPDRLPEGLFTFGR
ncbi:hypothetical protein J7337_013016 [Fusarium musae]|uniref:Uncharacterized protein n=1 Tax=Fusarium musae TaxID=1042133 RepID=A0A9P8D6T9_9HYPO|nr:hypothetical protein J7337_013016 [Fusarium musae]KAG9496428.1 hypothetical protein J7337_013016 [Fusarium musae]